MMRRYARRALVQVFPLTRLVMPANAALARMSTPDAFISVPIQPRKLIRVCMHHIRVKYDVGPAQRIVPLDMQSLLHPKTIESPLEIHKRSYYNVAVSKQVDHRSAHNQCIGLLGRAVLLSIEAHPLHWPVVPVDLRQPCRMSLLTEYDCHRLKLRCFSRQSFRRKTFWIR